MANIFALSSGRGKAGVAVIRISGDDALHCLRVLNVNFSEESQKPTPRKTYLKKLYRPNQQKNKNKKNNNFLEVIDTALVLYFAAPNSFTGEDVIEFHLHGSVAVVNEMLTILSKIDNYRPAEAGEFSKRAFYNGKMDLLQAEGLADLLEAETSYQLRLSQKYFSGAVSSIYESWREQLVEIMCFIEAYIDFPEEDIPEDLENQAINKITNLQSSIEKQLTKAQERIKSYADCVIIGRPNAGKSTFVNLLTQREVAIVSDIAGTTRDAIEVHLDIAGYPLTLIDTAGIRKTQDIIESKGVAIALNKAKETDFKIYIIDVSTDDTRQINSFLSETDFDKEKDIIICNKIDLLAADESQYLKNELQSYGEVIFTSLNDDNSNAQSVIFNKIEKNLENILNIDETPIIARQRHKTALEQTQKYIREYITSREQKDEPELSAEYLRLAAVEIGKITGKIGVEDILDRIFSEFCIGK